MEQFNLDKYLKNPTRKVVTKDGQPVRIICTDRKTTGEYNIIALNEDYEETATYTLDLFFAPEKQSRWVYLFRYYDRSIVVSDVFESKDEAEVAMKEDNGFALTEITWEE